MYGLCVTNPKEQQNTSYTKEGMLPNHEEPALTIARSMHTHSFALTELLTWGNSGEYASPCPLPWVRSKETRAFSNEERHENDMSAITENTSYYT